MVKINYSLVAQTINGMSAIYISCMQFEQTALLDTHIRVFPDEWDNQSKTVVNNPNAQRLNLLMRKAIYEIESYELSRDNVQLHQLKLMWENKDISEDFYKIIKVELPNREIKKSTKQSHIDTFKLLKRYRPACRVSELNEEWVKGFYQFVKSCLNRKGKPYKVGSINKHMEVFECYYHIARKLGGDKVPMNSFDWYRYKPERTEIKALKDHDVYILENYAATGKSKVLEQFLFMAYTGMRISDFNAVTEDCISKEGDVMWLTYTSQKTNIYTRLPLSSLFDRAPEKLIYKYLNKIPEFFCTGNNSAWNRKLNRHAAKAGLMQHLTAHMARHTCATRLLERKVGMMMIMKVLGHKKIDTTMIYAKITDNNLAKELLVS